MSAYGGLVPRQYQSGEVDGRGRISKRGPAILRSLMVQAAWTMLRYNAWARSVYERLSKRKARRKQAIVALARKLFVRGWAMPRDRTPWRGPPALSPQQPVAGAAGKAGGRCLRPRCCWLLCLIGERTPRRL